jgi:Ras-related C3 botulinum toxin substrate 1
MIVFLLCCSVVSPSSFKSITTKWLPEVRHHCSNSIPVVLIGTKIDLREEYINQDKPVVTYEEGDNYARNMGCVAYLETSARYYTGMSNLTKVFLNAPYVGRDISQKKKLCKTQ